jgi:hypothetical protein
MYLISEQPFDFFTLTTNASNDETYLAIIQLLFPHIKNAASCAVCLPFQPTHL